METKEILELIKESLQEDKISKFSIEIEWNKTKIEVEKSYISGIAWNVTWTLCLNKKHNNILC